MDNAAFENTPVRPLTSGESISDKLIRAEFAAIQPKAVDAEAREEPSDDEVGG